MKERLHDREWLQAQLGAGRSMSDIAAEVGVCRTTVKNYARKAGLDTPPPGGWFIKGKQKSPETRARMAAARDRYWASRPERDAHRLKISQTKTGGRPSKTHSGYRRVIDFDRPRGTMLEHRWVMEKALGRKLLPSEHIHHRDGDRSNNALSNLELWSRAHPPGQRVRDKLAWAREILALYGDLPPEVE